MDILKRLCNTWDEWSHVRGHWQELGIFFKIPAVRFFVSWFAIVPPIAHALSEVPEEIEITIAQNKITILLSLPFHWQLLWLSSLFYASAFLLYKWRCPSFIMKNPDFGVYDAKGHSPRWIAWEIYYTLRYIDAPTELAKRLVEKNYAVKLKSSEGENHTKPQVLDRGTVWAFPMGGTRYEVCVAEDENRNTVRDIFWEVFGHWSGSRPVWRNLVWGLVVISIGMFLVAVGQNIFAGLSFLFT